MGCGQSKNTVGVIDPRQANSKINSAQSGFTARDTGVHPSGSNVHQVHVEPGIDASVQTSRPSSRESAEGAPQKQKLIVSVSTQTHGTIPCNHVDVQTSRPSSSQRTSEMVATQTTRATTPASSDLSYNPGEVDAKNTDTDSFDTRLDTSEYRHNGVKSEFSSSEQTEGLLNNMPQFELENQNTKRPTSAQSETKSSSRPGSAQSETKSTSRPTSAEIEARSTNKPGSAQSETKSTNRPGSAHSETKSTNRPGSAHSETKSNSRPGSTQSETNSNRPTSSQRLKSKGTPADVINRNGNDGHMVSTKTQSRKEIDPKTFYKAVDEHARKAPESLKHSADDLVNYLSTPSKDPKMLVRAIFVWISENIRYDVEGLFGRAPRASCDAESVMIHGKSVCAGYANVMELLCRKAKIPVKTISGYAKGVGSSAEKPFTTNQATDHAWNAVQLAGKWFLLDSTWGAGHLDTSNEFKKEFNEHYFLTDPSEFVTAHFPYMDRDMEASMKWQLLEQPVTLEEFGKAVKYQSNAFKLNVKPISHRDGLIEMENEVELSFKFLGEDVVFSETLYHKDGNWLRSRSHNAFGTLFNGVYKIKVRPHTTGTFNLEIFGKNASESSNGPLGCLFVYVIKCRNTSNNVAEFPYAYSEAQTQKCILHEPLQNNLPAESRVHFRLTSPLLQNIRINQEYLTKSGNVFEGDIKAGPSGSNLVIFGSQNSSRFGMSSGLFQFKVL